MQSNRLTKPILPPNSSSSSTPINCEVVDGNGFVWSKDVYDVSNSQSQICVVIRTSCHVYCELIAKSVITHDQNNTMTSVISLSSPLSITPCPEATSLAVLSVNDEVNERMNTIMEEEEDISTMVHSSVNASYHGNVMEEEKEEEEVDCALVVKVVLMVMLNMCIFLKSVPLP